MAIMGDPGECPSGYSEKYIDILALPDLSANSKIFSPLPSSNLNGPDVAALVRGGKKYRRLPFVIEGVAAVTSQAASDLPISCFEDDDLRRHRSAILS